LAILKPQPVTIRFLQKSFGIGEDNFLSFGKKRNLIQMQKQLEWDELLSYLELEKKLDKWIEELHQEDIPVRTNNIIAQAINLDESGQFKRGNAACITRLVYHFLKRWDLSIHWVTRVGQKPSGHLQKVKDNTTTSIYKRFLPGHPVHGLDPHFFLNMDQTAVYFEANQKLL
jgi:Tc5 transposase DNA-binding domain